MWFAGIIIVRDYKGVESKSMLILHNNYDQRWYRCYAIDPNLQEQCTTLLVHTSGLCHKQVTAITDDGT